MNILVTGVLGFVGFNISKYFLKIKNLNVIGIDNLDKTLYPIDEKKNRLKDLKKSSNFNFFKINICNYRKLNDFISNSKISYVINLAGQASVRNSLDDYEKFIKDNILGFTNIINIAKNNNIKLIYASTSAVYNAKINKSPNSVKEKIYEPQSFYGVSKYINELIAKLYYEEYNYKSLGLRFFTVYGDSSRTDMAIYNFIDSIYKGKNINLYNYGNYYRDFVHVSTICSAIEKIIFNKKYDQKVLNIGSTKTYKLIKIVKILENLINKKAKIKLSPRIMNEPLTTKADMADTFKFLGKIKIISIKDGLKQTVEWYLKNNSK